MHYYLDGYNILFRGADAVGDLKKQRDLLIWELNEKVRALNLDVTVVFDAHYQLTEGTRSIFDSLEICFTEAQESADEYILKRLKGCASPKLETVVTSDNRLAWAARRYLAKTESVSEFLSWLNKRYNAKLKKEISYRENIQKSSLSKLPLVSKEYSDKTKESPSPKKTASESFDYYLYHFEKEHRESTSPTVSKEESKKTKRVSKSKKKKEIPEVISNEEPDMQRWLRLFQEKDPL